MAEELDLADLKRRIRELDSVMYSAACLCEVAENYSLESADNAKPGGDGDDAAIENRNASFLVRAREKLIGVLQFADYLLEAHFSNDPYLDVMEAVRNGEPVECMDVHPSYYSAAKSFCFDAFNAVLIDQVVEIGPPELVTPRLKLPASVRFTIKQKHAEWTRLAIDNGSYRFFSPPDGEVGKSPVVKFQQILEKLDPPDGHYKNFFANKFYAKAQAGLFMEVNVVLRNLENPALAIKTRVQWQSNISVQINGDHSCVTLHGHSYHVTPKIAKFFQGMIDAKGAPIPAEDRFKVKPRDLKKLPQKLQDILERKPGAGTRLCIESL